MKRPSYSSLLVIIFLASLPFVNPWVRGDGVQYYAYVRSLLVEHHLQFENDWRHANPGLQTYSVDAEGRISLGTYTDTGRLDNPHPVGASLLWAPFLIPVHAVLVVLNRWGLGTPADGFSRPYLVTLALATALYGFTGLLISYRLARHYVNEAWAFLATLGIWFATSLPVYMYFDPAYSHAHSVFMVAVFLWYWLRTRAGRTVAQWIVLGGISGLMLDVYYPNIAILLVPLIESLRRYGRAGRNPAERSSLRALFLGNLSYTAATLVAFLPNLITRQMIYGHPLSFGFWGIAPHWAHPALWQPLFSSNHGWLTWTPVVIPALVGLAVFRRCDSELATSSLVSVAAFYYVVACFPNWHGMSSFGNRIFLSLAPFLVLGLAASFQEVAQRCKRVWQAWAISSSAVGALVVWNLAFIFQWGTGLVPHVGAIFWKEMVVNQFTAVPVRFGHSLRAYFGERGKMMQRIEEQDIQRRQDEEKRTGQ